MRSGLPVILAAVFGSIAAAGRIYMHHAVLYRGKAAFNSVVRPLRHRVRLVERGLAVGPDFHVNVYPVPEKARLYLVYSNYCDRFQTMYRMSRSLSGPWIRPEQDTFDSRAYYAAKTGTDGKHRYIYGWNPTKELPKKNFNPANRISQDCCSWDWGGNLVVHRVLQNPDGTLRVVPEVDVDAALKTEHRIEAEPVLGSCEISPWEIRINGDCGFGGVLLNPVPRQCKLEGELSFSP